MQKCKSWNCKCVLETSEFIENSRTIPGIHSPKLAGKPVNKPPTWKYYSKSCHILYVNTHKCQGPEMLWAVDTANDEVMAADDKCTSVNVNCNCPNNDQYLTNSLSDPVNDIHHVHHDIPICRILVQHICCDNSFRSWPVGPRVGHYSKW